MGLPIHYLVQIAGFDRVWQNTPALITERLRWQDISSQGFNSIVSNERYGTGQ
jgi:hypothetical protein